MWKGGTEGVANQQRQQRSRGSGVTLESPGRDDTGIGLVGLTGKYYGIACSSLST
jgi:hypothetical protein